MSVFAIPRYVDCPAEISIQRPNRGGRCERELGNAEPVAGGIDETVFFVDYVL